MSKDCCILQTSGPRTLPVLRSLAAAGFDVWAPTAMQRKRRPRSDKYLDVEAAVLPCFVFADYDALPELLTIQHAPLSHHPAFTVLQHQGKPGRVADKSLAPLRDHEARAAVEWEEFLVEEARRKAELARRKKSKKPAGRFNRRRAYVLGQTVRVLDPAFEGLTAEVVQVGRNHNLVLVVDGRMKINVDTCDVEEIQIGAGQPTRAKAA